MKSFRFGSLLNSQTKSSVWGCARATVLLAIVASAVAANAEPLTFRRAVQLAVSHSSATGAAAADQMRAYESYRETRDAYLPQMIVGSGLGASYGFPLSIEGAAPSLFSVNTQQFLVNFAQHEFVRAARSEWKASSMSAQDKREQVMLDAALTYIQLDNALTQFKLLQEQQGESKRVIYVVAQRVNEGIDAKVELTRANLMDARVRMRLAEVSGNVDLLRQHLAELTGVPAQSIDTVTESVPGMPEVSEQEDVVPKALASSSALKAAQETAVAKEFTAKGQHKALLPAIDLAGQYALLTRFNNYDEFFRKFQRHNATVGLSIRFPFLNPAQRAHANAADAEALKAKKDAEAVKGQVSSDTLKLQRTAQQLAAARDVAKYDYELSQADLETVKARLQTGTATLRDQGNAQLAVNQKYGAFLDASLELDKVRLQLMKATGELEKWVGQ